MDRKRVAKAVRLVRGSIRIQIQELRRTQAHEMESVLSQVTN